MIYKLKNHFASSSYNQFDMQFWLSRLWASSAWCMRSEVTAIIQLLVKCVTFLIFSSPFSLSWISEKVHHLKVLNNGHPYIGFFFYLVSNALTSSLSQSIDLDFSLQRNLGMLITITFLMMETLLRHNEMLTSKEKREIVHKQTRGSPLKTHGVDFLQMKGSPSWRCLPGKNQSCTAVSRDTHFQRPPCSWASKTDLEKPRATAAANRLLANSSWGRKKWSPAKILPLSAAWVLQVQSHRVLAMGQRRMRC